MGAASQGWKSTRWWGVALRDWPETLRDAGLSTLRDNVTGKAAGLTYFMVLTVFPALIAFVSLLVVVGHAGAVSSLLGVISDLGPVSGSAVGSPVRHALTSGGSAGTLLATGVFALLAASTYVGAFGGQEGSLRGETAVGSFWARRRRQSLIAVAVLGLLGLMCLGLVLSPALFVRAGGALGSGSIGLTLYKAFRWPALFVAALVLFNLLYLSSPAPVHRAGRSWITGGSVVGMLSWLLATWVYDLYARHVSHYQSLYGAFGDLLAFLLWLWMLNIALLGGVELNRQLERRRGDVPIPVEDESRGDAGASESGVAGADAQRDVGGGSERPRRAA